MCALYRPILFRKRHLCYTTVLSDTLACAQISSGTPPLGTTRHRIGVPRGAAGSGGHAAGGVTTAAVRPPSCCCAGHILDGPVLGSTRWYLTKERSVRYWKAPSGWGEKIGSNSANCASKNFKLSRSLKFKDSVLKKDITAWRHISTGLEHWKLARSLKRSKWQLNVDATKSSAANV